MAHKEKSDQKRSAEITRRYFDFIDKHTNDVSSGRVSEFMELNQIARELAVSHKHLTDSVQKETQHHPCHFYDTKIIEKAKQLMADPQLSIAQIAMALTYDPSNFSKFFKKFTGETPGAFRKKQKTNNT